MSCKCYGNSIPISPYDAPAQSHTIRIRSREVNFFFSYSVMNANGREQEAIFP